VGFDILDLVQGKFIIKRIKLQNGDFEIIQYKDHSLNIRNAFEPQVEIDDVAEEFHLDLKNIRIENIHLTKNNLNDSLKVDVVFEWANSNFSTSEKYIDFGIDSKFTMQILKGFDTTFVKNKHLEIHTHLKFDKLNRQIMLQPSELTL
ncbi:hypothetical protein RZS08_11025, partial [Arthrospira platensis SPKY1]|nr:hypothetical protein [Arthrospira platensis SPKY1]